MEEIPLPGRSDNIYRGQMKNDDPENDLDDLEHAPNIRKPDLETRLLEVICRKPELTYQALGEELSVSAATIKRTLVKLKRKGVVVREGSNRKGKWKITGER